MDGRFIKYYNYGYGLTTNLVLSYIVGWGSKGTYASNQHLSKILDCSVSSVQRSLKFLKKENLIKIHNPKGRSRYITTDLQPGQIDLHNIVNLTNIPGQNDLHNQVKMTDNKIEDKIENKIDDNIAEKKEKISKRDYYEMISLMIKEFNITQMDAEEIIKTDYEIV